MGTVHSPVGWDIRNLLLTLLRQEYEKRNRKQNQGVIIEVIYLKHKKQSKQHLSQNDDPVVRTVISSVKHVSNN